MGRDHRLRGVALAGSRLAAASPVTEAPGIQLRVRVPFFVARSFFPFQAFFWGADFVVPNALSTLKHHSKRPKYS